MFGSLKISTKILFVTISVAVVVITSISFITDMITRDATRTESFNKLTAVREMKAQQIEDYFHQIRDQVLTYSENHMIIDAMMAFSESFDSQTSKNHHNQAVTLKHYYQNEFLPRLSANSQSFAELTDHWPEDTTTQMFQYQYIAENINPVGKKHQLDAATDLSNYCAAHHQYHPVIRNYLETFGYYDIFLVDADSGYIVYSVFKEVDYATSLLTGPYHDANIAEVFRRAQQAGKNEVIIVDFAPYAPSYNDQAAFIASPIFNGDRRVGVLIFQMPVKKINEIMTNRQNWSSVGLGQTGEMYLIGDDYRLRNQSRFLIEDKQSYLKDIAAQGTPKSVVDQIDNLNNSIGLQEVKTLGAIEAFTGEQSNIIHDNYRGIPVLSSSRLLEIKGLNWAIISEIAESEAFEVFTDLRYTMIMVGSILLILAACLSFFLSFSLTRSLRALSGSAESLTKGELNQPIPSGSSDEIGDLAKIFEVMRVKLQSTFAEVERKNEELEQRVSERTDDLDKALSSQKQQNQLLEEQNVKMNLVQQDLLESRELTEAILQGSPDGIVSIDQRGVIETFNRSAESIFNYNADWAIGRNVKILMPKAVAIEHDYYLEHYNPDDGSSKIVGQKREVEAMRKDGSLFPLELKVESVTVRDKTIFIGLLRDISEQKARESRDQQETRKARLLDRIAAEAAESDQFDEVLDHVLRLICEVIDWPVGHVYMASPDITRLLPTNIWHFKKTGHFLPFKELTAQTEFELGADLPGRVAQNHVPLWIENLQADTDFTRNQLAEELGILSGFGFPVNLNDKTIAVLEFYNDRIAPPNEAVLELMWEVSDQLGRIYERKRISEELRCAQEAADAANQAKSDFLANMSHEIRTPMNAVIGLSHLCLMTDMTKKQQDYLSKIHASAGALLGIINDILDFSKIEAGKLNVEAVPFEIDAVLENLATVVQVKTQEKGLELLFDRDPALPAVLVGDSLRIGQILVNLCNNAAKFTEKGDILVTIRMIEEDIEQDPNKIKLECLVRDTGIGMTQEQLGRLFQSFSQADTSTTRKYGGTGLGLAISKQLVQLMGGDIWVESEAGVGSLFGFSLVLGVGSEKTERTYKPAPDIQNLNVLVVDDNVTSCEILQGYLTAFGYKVKTVNNPSDAIAVIKDQLLAQTPSYDLIVTDWMMPNMSGLDLATQIKTELRPKSPPKIIMMSAFHGSEITEKLGGEYIDDFLNKPISPSHLFDSIMRIFGHEVIESTRHNRNLADADYESLKPIQGARILLVEDNDINQQIAKELLEHAYFIVEIANHGQEALSMLAKQKYDCVLMDIQMPVMDGYTATKKIREQVKYQALPILAMTANATLEDREKSLNSGMNGHINKPIDPKDLFAMLLTWIEHKERELPVRDSITSDDREQSSELPDLPGIDTDSGIRRMGGNVSSYLKLLTKFVCNQSGAINEISKGHASGDYLAAERLSHTLKGVAASLGADDLSAKAGQLEKALQTQPDVLPEALLEQTSVALEQTVKLLRTKLKLDAVDVKVVVVKKDREPSSNNKSEALPADFKLQLESLMDKLNQYDAETEDAFDNILTVARGTIYQDALEALGKLIGQYDFEDAAKQLKDILEQLENSSHG